MWISKNLASIEMILIRTSPACIQRWAILPAKTTFATRTRASSTAFATLTLRASLIAFVLTSVLTRTPKMSTSAAAMDTGISTSVSCDGNLVASRWTLEYPPPKISAFLVPYLRATAARRWLTRSLVLITTAVTVPVPNSVHLPVTVTRKPPSPSAVWTQKTVTIATSPCSAAVLTASRRLWEWTLPVVRVNVTAIRSALIRPLVTRKTGNATAKPMSVRKNFHHKIWCIVKAN